MKKPQSWYTASTHALTGGIITPLVIRFIIFAIIGSVITISSFATQVVTVLIANALALWAGVYLSNKYIAKKYNIDSPDKIINLSTLFTLIIQVLISLKSLRVMEGSDFVYGIIAVSSFVIFFYIFSKLYVKRNI